MNILIADDSRFIQNIIKKTLLTSFSDAQIVTANDGMEAFEDWKLCKPDVIITDLLMPNIDGLQLIKLIKDIDSDSKIIVVSADVQQVVKEEVEALGVKIFINKPLNDIKLEQLLDFIRKEIVNA